jgi:hypothetical protein
MSLNDNCCLPGVESATCPEDDLLGCGCCLSTQPFILEAGSYTRGTILYTTGNGSVLGQAGIGTDPSTAFAIMPFSITLADPDSMAVYKAGEYNQDLVSGFGDLDAVKIALSKQNIKLRKFG